MPAVRMTNVMPIARSPVIETCRMTLKRLMDERKRGSSVANTAISTSRKISGAKRARNEKASKPCAASFVVMSVIVLSPAQAACAELNVISVISLSWVAPVLDTSPVTRPSRMVTIRSASDRISVSSDEMTIMAIPDAAI